MANQQQSSSVSAAVITRGVPSHEIHYEDQQAYKKEEKESHYSRHVNSNSSFGGGLNNNAKTIFGKQMTAQDEFEGQQ